MKKSSDTIFYIKVFFWLIIFLVIFSLFLRLSNLIINSSFNNNSFSVLYVSRNSKIINVDDKSKTVTFISIGNVENVIKGKSPFVISVALGVPINGIIYDENKNLDYNFPDFISYGNEARLALSFRTVFKNLNEYDLHRIMSIARSADKDNVKSLEIDLLNDVDVKDKLEGVFLDKTIIDEKYTVEIVNGTNINGLANSVASIFSQKGYNIVFLQSHNGRFDEDSYIGYEFERNSYIDSLKKLTQFEEKKKTISRTADVTIYLGLDLEAQFND